MKSLHGISENHDYGNMVSNNALNEFFKNSLKIQMNSLKISVAVVE